MSNNFDWKHLLCAQIKIDKLSIDIEKDIATKSLDEKIEFYYNKLNSQELENFCYAQEFCEQQLIKLKRERLLVRYPRHSLPKRVKKGQNKK